MKQLTAIIILLIGNIAIASAQNKLTQINIQGRVLTEEKQPLAFANIALLTLDSVFVQGTCSRNDGSFEILASASSGDYLLQISSIGYKTLCRRCCIKKATEETGDKKGAEATSDTGDWMLETDAVKLAETVVTAARPVFRLKGGKLETIVHQSLLASLNNAEDVLKHIPGLHISEDEYTVFGKGKPIIYIDNRRLQDLSELQRLSAADIDKVELITNPGAEYDVTVKAVIRIRTLRGKKDGSGGNIRLGIAQRRLFSHNEQLNLNYQKKGFLLLATLHANYQNSRRSQEVRYQIPSGSAGWDINSGVQLRNKGLLAGGKASVSYDFNPKHSLGVSYDYNRTPDFRLNDTSEYTVSKGNEMTDRTAHSSGNLQQSTRHQLNTYYLGTIRKFQINFTADLVLGKNYDHQEARETSQTEGDRNISSFNHANNRLYAAKLILTHPLWKGELKAGTDYTFIRRSDNFLNLQNILPNTNSRIDESKAAAFAQYSLVFGKVSLLAGLRFEHVVSDYQEQGQYLPGQSRTYSDWCPDFSFDFPIGKAQANLSYTVKKDRPSFFQLRSTLSYNNRFVYEGGNPQLTPETNHDLQFSTLYKWMQLGLNYQYRRNAITFTTKEYEDNPDVVIFTTGNFKQMQYLTAFLHLSPTIVLWKPELGIYFTQTFFRVTNQGTTRNLNRASIYLSWQNSFQLPGDWIFSLDADYQSKGNFGAMLQHSYWGINAGLRKTFFNKKLTIGLQANDLWNSRFSSFMLFGPRMTYTKKANPDSRTLSLSLNYRFNANGKEYKGGHVSEKDLQRL